MKHFSAGYSCTNQNFVIQNLPCSVADPELQPLLLVLKNILCRGSLSVKIHTSPSEFLLQKLKKLGVSEADLSDAPLALISNKPPPWTDRTIKGGDNANPAFDFFNNIPNIFRGAGFDFLQQLLLPECPISQFCQKDGFTNQQVDFYSPDIKLIIEIDGVQHVEDKAQQLLDAHRDTSLRKEGFETIRIQTKEAYTKATRNGDYHKYYKEKIDEIVSRCRRTRALTYYKETLERLPALEKSDIQSKLLPTAIIRFQILLIELLLSGKIDFSKEWDFYINFHELDYGNGIENFPDWAILDFFEWFKNLYFLKNKKDLAIPKYSIRFATNQGDENTINTTSIKIDFSLLERYSDEYLQNKDTIFVRTDYFGKEKNYFCVSDECPQIDYNIPNPESVEKSLSFFLKNIFGHDKFRPKQAEIICNALNLKNTIGLLPTGAGKSLCYQLPCILQPGKSIVVSPLVALMRDQCKNMHTAGLAHTEYLASDSDSTDRKRILDVFSKNKLNVLLVSPERFQTEEFRQQLSSFKNISYFIIDEIHCMSEWGHDFRTSYLNLIPTIYKFYPGAKIIGLTATASMNVLSNIKAEFSKAGHAIKNTDIVSKFDFNREELVFKVEEYISNDDLMDLLFSSVKNQQAPAIVFTPHVNGDFGCFDIYCKIHKRLADANLHQSIGWFSGSAPKRSQFFCDSTGFINFKKETYEKFKQNQIHVLFATKAFGMGIDKNDISATFHCGLPASVESFYQEAGRAGRWEDFQKKATCTLFFNEPYAYYKRKINKLFEQDTSIAEIDSFVKNNSKDGSVGDICNQLFLFVNSVQDPTPEFNEILRFIRNHDIINKKKLWLRKRDIAEKIIYRLVLCGIIEDYTHDFKANTFTIFLKNFDDDSIVHDVEKFIKAYEPTYDIGAELIETSCPHTSDVCTQIGSTGLKAIWILLQWIFDHIVYSRKQSLRTLYDFCCEYEDPDSFKKSIIDYFKTTDATDIFSKLTSNPLNYAALPQLFSDPEEAQKSLRRFLESNQNNLSLDLASGLLSLTNQKYDTPDGAPRLENALKIAKREFREQNELKKFLSFLTSFANSLFGNDSDKKVQLSLSLIKVLKNKNFSVQEHLASAFKLNCLYFFDEGKKINNIITSLKKYHDSIRRI